MAEYPVLALVVQVAGLAVPLAVEEGARVLLGRAIMAVPVLLTFLLTVILAWPQGVVVVLEPLAQTGWRLVTTLGLLPGVTAGMAQCGAMAWPMPVAAGLLHALQAGHILCRMEVADQAAEAARPLTEQQIPEAVLAETHQAAFRLETAARALLLFGTQAHNVAQEARLLLLADTPITHLLPLQTLYHE